MLDLAEEWDPALRSTDPLAFPGYQGEVDDLDGESVRTGRTDRFVVIESRFEVFGGSMGVVAGEKVCRAIDRAVELRLPIVCVTRSGGARMQEGMVSLLQLGRTAAAMNRHAAAGLLSIAVFRSPTMGGVLASYGSLCDVRAAITDATVGFAGPRVVQQTTGEVVGVDSHTAASALAHGLVDTVIAEEDVPAWIDGVLGALATPLAPRALPVVPEAIDLDGPRPGTAWSEVLTARRADRPTGVDVAAAVTTSWTELASADPTIRAGLATLGGERVVVVATDRHAGSGRPTPTAFRLAQRAIALAGRLDLPLVSFVDTPGADPGGASENDGIAGEIARTFAAMAALPTASVGVCVGEGGSGGALALAWTDALLVQQHAVFSVIGPEGAAAILERDAAKAPEVAELLALTSADLLRLGIVDAVVPDDLAEVGPAVVAALADAVPGTRSRRADDVSARWVASRVRRPAGSAG